MGNRLKPNAGPSPRYCGACGAKIADMRPGTCIGDTEHIPETEMETPPSPIHQEPSDEQ